MSESSPTPSPAADTLPPNSGLRNYTIIKTLGHGGFGTTYLVHDENLDADYVLKEYLPRMLCSRNTTTMQISALDAQDPNDTFNRWKDRFWQEARTLAKLNHPNIIRVKDLFNELGTAYYVMEFIDGQELHLATESNRSESTLQHLLRRLLSALQYLHGKGILHRDIKPSNILVKQGGEPVLIDFGAIRAMGSELPGTQISSPGYSPLEQKSGEGQLGPWTDLYALGATFCHALTGQCPPDSIARLMGTSFAPLAERAELKAAYSHPFLSALDKALEPLPQNRWQTAEEWLAALDTPPAEEASTAALQEYERQMAEYTRKMDEYNCQMAEYNRKLEALKETEKATNATLETEEQEQQVEQAVTQATEKDTMSAEPTFETDDTVPAPNNDSNSVDFRSDIYKRLVQILQQSVRAKALQELKTHSIIHIHSRDSLANTPLHWAGEKGNTGIAQLLLIAGADINAKNNDGYTPLHKACLIGNTETAKLLLEAGADINAKNNDGITPLHEACRNGKTETVKLLQMGGADINAKSNIGNTPLHMACWYGETKSAELLLKSGADIEAKNISGNTPLHDACRRGKTETVKLLLGAGANYEAKDNNGVTPLQRAFACGNNEIAQILIKAGAKATLWERLKVGSF